MLTPATYVTTGVLDRTHKESPKTWTSPDETPVTNPGERQVWSMLSTFLLHLSLLANSVYLS